MASDSLDLPRTPTPTRAVSSEPSLARRDSMEDADSSVTRKRPRLDSGARAHRSMSADKVVGGSGDSEHDDPASLPPHPGSIDPTPLRTPSSSPKQLPSLHRTPSRVTINVRTPLRPSPTPNSTLAPEPASTGPPPRPEEALAVEMDKDTEQEADGGGDGSRAISISSSAARSPEIEVAEVEDMDQDPHDTRWTSVVNITGMVGTLQTLLDTFPLSEKYSHPQEPVAFIGQIFEKGMMSDGQLLDAVADWFTTFLHETEHEISRWWEMYTDAREFWDRIPDMVECLLRRRTVGLGAAFIQHPQMTEAAPGLQSIEAFFRAYALLVARFVQLDLHTIEQLPEDISVDPDLVSRAYVQTLVWIPTEIPLWNLLRETCGYTSLDIITSTVGRFAQPPSNGIQCLSRYVSFILEHMINFPKMTLLLWPPIHLVGKTLQYSTAKQSAKEEGNHAGSDLTRSITRDAFGFFKVVDEKLQLFVSKQISALTIDLSKDLVAHLSTFLRRISQLDGSLASALAAQVVPSSDHIDAENFPELIEFSWRSKLLKRCITAGRMEIRVQGIETMQQDLVSVWTKHMRNNEAGKHHPVVQFLVKYILDSRLVEYIVGVESHPQLITRSANIVGFLVVTCSYTDHHSDAIWQAVTTSQDPRFVDAILGMLTNIFRMSPYSALIYLCKKLNELPVRAFDGRMMGYAGTLLDQVRRRFQETQPDSRLDSPPYDLCIRLIRQATTASELTPNGMTAIHNFAMGELSQLVHLGPRDEDRKKIYHECIGDIAAKSPHATGSIFAINALLAQDPSRDIETLASQFELTRLVVDELAHIIQDARRQRLEGGIRSDVLSARLELLQRIILHIPGTITPEHGERLWNALIGRDALGEEERNSAWSMLVGVTGACHTRNVFIDRCINEYLPQLDPALFTIDLLTFVQQAIAYQARLSPPPTANEHDVIDIPGVDQLWQIVLIAPSGTIEIQATHKLVEFYLDTPLIRKAPRTAVEATHVALIKRCVDQLTGAALKLRSFSDGTASGEDEPMVIVASDEEVRTEELRLSRSLLFLREILRGMRARPQYSPPPNKAPELAKQVKEFKGDAVKISYQAFNGGVNTGVQAFEAGDQETVEELTTRLKKLTGFSKFTAIAGGQKLDLTTDTNKTLRDLKIGRSGLLMIRRVPDSTAVQPIDQAQALSAVEAEVLKHFDELYQLLGLDERFAREIFDFLTLFPPQERVRRLVLSEDEDSANVFPAGQPFKILYSTKTLKVCLGEQLQNVEPEKASIHTQPNGSANRFKGIENQRFISRGVKMLIAALTERNVVEASSDNRLKLSIAVNVVDCLLTFLKEPVAPETSITYFEDGATLVERLVVLLRVGNEAPLLTLPIAADLTCGCFATILEASLHSSIVWTSFKNRPDISDLMRSLLLDDPRPSVRKGVADAVAGVCGPLPKTTRTPVETFVSFFWDIVSTLLPQAIDQQGQSQQLFELALSILRVMGPGLRVELDLAFYIGQWSDLLLKHRHEEFVGRETLDFIALGFTNLLRWGSQAAKSLQKPLVTGTLMEDLFNAHLFPDLSPVEGERKIIPRIPVLHSQTRREMYAVIVSLSQNTDSYQKLLALVKELVPQGRYFPAWSWGLAQTSQDYDYEPNWNFERSKMIRSPTGYPGLRNLSNTCYLNSLFTQLFMNVTFRRFMLEANIADGDGAQRLLAETKKLFAHMQSTWLKAVDPQGVAESIRTYDSEAIDVSVQMDVDEFYNLLFDRWEGQILSEEAKKKFRSFYGGQLVQQIKSKECEHISERLEPFSAIQCDIKGMATLQESLSAYVEGEVMEGDNKYSCTSCGRHVDAVKRACLKDVPDNLIFHLKRFDYDVNSGQRSKINDRFDFSEKLDMAPFKIDYLSEQGNIVSPDMFELVGVLVHSGTAESGHYYSYIRERPVNPSQVETWVEFNDADVSRFDPSKIPDQCFGGFNDPLPNSAFPQLRFYKAWNAYMLFYQRISSIEEIQAPSQLGRPIELPVSLDLYNHIAMENEMFIRKYCLFDPAHAPFVRSLLDQLRYLSKGSCSEDHSIEKEAIWLALEHIDQVISRTKDIPDFDSIMTLLGKVIGTCADCCKLALDWVSTHPHAMRNLLLRSTTPKVRQDFGKMVFTALHYLRQKDQRLYGLESQEAQGGSNDEDWVEVDGAFQSIVRRLKELLGIIQTHARAWDEYFGLLAEMANLGAAETSVILQEGFLKRCLEILLIESSGGRNLKQNLSMVKLLEKGRKYSHHKLIELVWAILKRIDLLGGVVKDEYDDRPYSNGMFLLTDREESYMRYGSELRAKNIIFLERMLSLNHNTAATTSILQMMLRAEPRLGLLPHIYKTIMNGIGIDPASLAGPYLQAGITFCESSPSPVEAKEMVSRTALDVETIDGNGGKEHLEFFSRVRRVRNMRFTRNPHFFDRLVLERMPDWAPPLLLYWEEGVRKETLQLLQRLVFDHDINTVDDEETVNLLWQTARDLCMNCLKRIKIVYIQEQQQAETKTIESIVLVIRHCLENYFDADSAKDRRLIREAEVTLEELATLTVEEADDVVSEGWDVSSNPPSDPDFDTSHIPSP